MVWVYSICVKPVFSFWVCFRIGFGYHFEGYRSSFLDYSNIQSIGLSWDFFRVFFGFRACLSNSSLFLRLCFKVALLHKTCGLPVARLPSSLDNFRASAFSGAKRRIQHKTTSQIHTTKNIGKKGTHPPDSTES